VECPQDQQGDGKSEHECAKWCVTEAAARGEAEEIFEVGGEGADHKRGGNEAGASEREGRGGVGWSEGHVNIIYQGVGGGAGRREELHGILERRLPTADVAQRKSPLLAQSAREKWGTRLCLAVRFASQGGRMRPPLRDLSC